MNIVIAPERLAYDPAAARIAAKARRERLWPSRPPRLAPDAVTMALPLSLAPPVSWRRDILRVASDDLDEPVERIGPAPRIKPGTVHDWLVVTEPRIPSIKLIQHVVARHYDVLVTDILSARRTRNVVTPRQVAMYFARELTSLSFPTIGNRFGDRDHSTCLHGHRKIARLVKETKAFADEIATVRMRIAAAVTRVEVQP